MSPGLRRRLAHALDRRFEALHHRVEGVANDVAGLREEVARAQADVARLARRLDDEISTTLRILAGRDAENRRLLAEARSDPEYELAFTAPNPLVTVVLPTYRRPGLLRTRSLPAALAQTHERLEVLVIGDGPDPEAEQVVRELDDDRVRWTSLPQRHVYPDAQRHWLASSTLARNEGYRLARGGWLFDFDDDDSTRSRSCSRRRASGAPRRFRA